MKSTGILRKVDELGRIVVPKELRNQFGIKEKDALEIYTEGDKIILKKYVAANTCDVTGEITENPIYVKLADKELVLNDEGLDKLLKHLNTYKN